MASTPKANQTIVQSAVAAYTPAKPTDWKGYVEGMGALAKLSTAAVAQAGENVNKLDKAWNLIDFDNFGGQIETEMLKIRNSPDLTIQEKLNIFERGKTDLDNLSKFGDTLKTLMNEDGGVLSASTDVQTTNWITSIINNTYQDRNSDGVIDEDEMNFSPVIIENGRLKIMNFDGTAYVPVGEIQSGFTTIDDGKALKGVFDGLIKDLDETTTKKGFGKTAKPVKAAQTYKNRIFKENILPELRRKKNVRQSMAFDQLFTYNDENGVSQTTTFAEYYLSKSALFTGAQAVGTGEGVNTFIDQWNKYHDEENLDLTTKKKMQDFLIHDAMKYDSNFDQDFEDFLELILDSYVGGYTK